MKSDTLTGFWASTNVYQSVTGLPVIRSLRSATASIILERVRKLGHQTILSIGIGTGDIYKHVLVDEIENGSLSVLGLDVSLEMIQSIAKNFPSPSKIVDKPVLPARNEAAFAHWNVTSGLDLPADSIDIVEAVLVLHHIPYEQQLQELFTAIYKVLKTDGVFIIGDIDLDIASYIESKENHLKERYKTVIRESSRGVFSCGEMGNQTILPILDQTHDEDRKLIDYMMNASFDLLKQEAIRHGTKSTLDAINIEIESALKGCELNRPISEWLNIIRRSFREDNPIQVLDPETIRKKYPDVLDRPFILIASKHQ